MHSSSDAAQTTRPWPHAALALSGLTIALLLAAALIWRLPDFRDGVGAQNLEASYHVLLSLDALDESGVVRHWWLPSVTLGAENAKRIPCLGRRYSHA